MKQKRTNQNWLEVVHIRTAQNRSVKLLEALHAMLAELRARAVGPEIHLYGHPAIPTEFSLYLIHESGSEPLIKSEVAQLISSIAQEYGMVNYSMWVKETQNNQSTGDSP